MQGVKISPEELTLPAEEPVTESKTDEIDTYQTDATLFVVNKEELGSRPRRMFPKSYNPFNVNLHELPYVEYMTCLLIGERGALSLALEFIKGATPRLMVLNLTNCRIKTRGLGRLLYGIKLGNLSSLRRLILKGNDIEPRGISLIQGVIASATFANLTSIDLRDNELGDVGLDLLMKMLAAGEVGGLNEIMLHRNGITDLGFTMFMKLIPRIKNTFFPNIVRISLDGNKITPAVKKQFKPYPNFISC
jgi:Leucine Rich repeat